MSLVAQAPLRLLLAMVGVISAPLAAQQSAPPLPTAEQLVGTWEGIFQSDHVPPGPLRLVVARDSAWRVTTWVRANDQEFSAVASEVILDGNILTWQHEMMGQPCSGRVILEGTTLKGEASCGGGGLSFTLTRLPPATGGQDD